MKFDDFLFCCLQAVVDFIRLTIEHILTQFLVMGDIIQLVASNLDSFIVSDDISIQFFNFRNKSVALLSISIFELTQLDQHVMGMLLQIPEHLGLKFGCLADILHLTL